MLPATATSHQWSTRSHNRNCARKIGRRGSPQKVRGCGKKSTRSVIAIPMSELEPAVLRLVTSYVGGVRSRKRKATVWYLSVCLSVCLSLRLSVGRPTFLPSCPKTDIFVWKKSPCACPPSKISERPIAGK